MHDGITMITIPTIEVEAESPQSSDDLDEAIIGRSPSMVQRESNGKNLSNFVILKGVSENIVTPGCPGITSGNITSHSPGTSQLEKYALIIEEEPAKEHRNLTQAEEHSTYIHNTNKLTVDLVAELLERNPESSSRGKEPLAPVSTNHLSRN